MPRISCIVGEKYGRLKIAAPADPAFDSKSGNLIRRSLCLCDCGKEVVIRNNNLRNGHTLSCGCLHAENTSIAKTLHGHARQGRATKTYRAWCAMIRRCSCSPGSCDYMDYVARGIKVCTRWENSFSSFLADMGEAPPYASLDRINNSGNYSCGSCDDCRKNGWPKNTRWATAIEQARNKRNNRIFEVRGVSASLAEHCENFGASRDRVKMRLKAGWSIEMSLFHPKMKNKHALA